MSWCYLSINIPKALPCHHRLTSHSQHGHCANSGRQSTIKINSSTKQDHMMTSRTSVYQLLVVTGGLVLSTVQPAALAVTGVNYEEDLTWTLIQSGISALLYFIVFPPIIMNWLRIRWYKRNLLEMYLQFMFVFLFFPGVLLWAPFLNFRKFPRDPSMKYPWSTPENPSQIKGGFKKYPWARPEDYEV